MKNYVWALILGIGVALSGYFIYCGIEKIANKDRHVTVKGLSEREVMADKVTWSLSYNVAGNALEFLYESLEPKQDKLIKFLKSNGVKDDEIFLDVPSAEDRSSWYNWNEKKDVMARFVVTGRLTIVSSDVEKIMTLRMKQLDLLKQGVLLDNSYCSYEYTGLNDLKPEMAAFEIKDKLVAAINENKYDFIVANFANADMVGHTGVYTAIQTAVKTIDQCLNEIVEVAKAMGYETIITADHGNADHALNADGTPNTAHSTNPVPFIYVTANQKAQVHNGALADVAPSILHIMGLQQPKEMTGQCLIKE